MLAIEIRFGETPVRASHAPERWTRALPRAAIGRRLPACDAPGSDSTWSCSLRLARGGLYPETSARVPARLVGAAPAASAGLRSGLPTGSRLTPLPRAPATPGARVSPLPAA